MRKKHPTAACAAKTMSNRSNPPVDRKCDHTLKKARQGVQGNNLGEGFPWQTHVEEHSAWDPFALKFCTRVSFHRRQVPRLLH